MRQRIATLITGLILLVLAGEGFSFPGQDDTTPGTLALFYKQQNNIWSRIDLGLVDAKITSEPPDTTRFDRRIEGFAMLGFDAVIGSRFGFRMNARSDYSIRKQEEEGGTGSTVEETQATNGLEVDFTFVTDKGLEIFFGLHAKNIEPYEQVVDTETTESSTFYKSALIQSRRMGVVRRGGVWSGGFYYEVGAEESRDFLKTASDDTSISGSETVFLPPRMGVFGEFNAFDMLWDFELTFVQARGVGPRDQNNNTIYTDFFRAKFGGIVELGGLSLKTSFAHQTQSYSDSAFISLDTMPVSTLKTVLLFGSPESHFFIGGIYGFGRDGQSLPEFNTTYELDALAITTGVFIPL